MPAFKDLAGRRFSKLLVVERITNNSSGKVRWLCACDCGETAEVTSNSLTQGTTHSCGCYHRQVASQANIKHGHSRINKVSPEYNIWRSMIKRCERKKDPAYKNYGARGIKVCVRWANFENFFTDMGLKPKGMTLERMNNNQDYCPENCKWATRIEQGNNTRRNRLVTINGEAKTVAECAREYGINYSTLISRLNRGVYASKACGLKPSRNSR